MSSFLSNEAYRARYTQNEQQKNYLIKINGGKTLKPRETQENK